MKYRVFRKKCAGEGEVANFREFLEKNTIFNEHPVGYEDSPTSQLYCIHIASGLQDVPKIFCTYRTKGKNNNLTGVRFKSSIKKTFNEQ